MDKSSLKISEKKINILSSNNYSFESKTTDINILLNRVKLEKQNNLKKKLILTSLILTIVSAITFIVFI